MRRSEGPKIWWIWLWIKTQSAKGCANYRGRDREAGRCEQQGEGGGLIGEQEGVRESHGCVGSYGMCEQEGVRESNHGMCEHEGVRESQGRVAYHGIGVAYLSSPRLSLAQREDLCELWFPTAWPWLIF